ncbi:oligoendopeptidase F [Deinococcus psychrotolerans]|uniref:Oligopeptidase F n=1 Tax=Deinococcus psychrotolerans TaxID=2489213 RepID=A0A3G8Y8X3_9DEIO|nr:oligoendopeptidase F [Deinococcus psychrotolerans]AZI41812.1 oligoendopeptidase F [Deinococcus psychrotolerans]
MTATPPARKDVPREQTWDIEALYATPQDWDTEAAALAQDAAALGRYAGTLGQSPEALAQYLSACEAVRMRLTRLMSYAGMAASVDGKDTEAAARRDRASSLGSVFAAATAFESPELLALDEKTVRPWLTRPDLADFAVMVERVWRGRPHIRSAEVEELLGLVQAPFASERGIHPALANMDLDFGQVGGVQIGQGNIDRLIADPDRQIRQQAWESYADAHLSTQHTMAAALSTHVRQNVFMARARRYPDALTAALTSDHIPTAVFHTLIDTYKANIHIWHRYWQVRRRWLGLDQLREYDVKAPLVSPPPLSYQESVDAICAGMQPLGDDYVSQMRSGLTTERWVDYANNAGKRQGAYSNGGARVKPYIFMSFQGGLSSMSTLAHEIGHSMHSHLAQQAQASSVPRYTLFAAEVASNFNQAMVRHHLFATNTDPTFEVALIEEAVSNFHRYFFIMPTLARFELEIHRRIEAGESLSAPDLNTLMADLLQDGYGEGVQVDRERSGITWGEFSTHLYANFYAYQYATGISAAHQLRAGFDTDPETARTKYLQFLSEGGRLDPLDALSAAGVDLSTARPVEETFKVLSGYVDRLEVLLSERT